jgi:DNA-binding CsgD family transcriptional regulator
MAIWDTLLYWIGLRPTPGPRTYEITESLHVSLTTLAQHEGRPEHELLPDILAAGLTQYSTKDRIWKKWESLTPREQEVTALVCLGYTNGQVAVRMGITEAGVKFHLRNVYSKFQVKNRGKLRQKLAGWDFTGWLKLSQSFHLVK